MAEYSANITSEEIKQWNDLEIDVFAVCTDNKIKMLKARELLKKKHENLITYGCFANYVNLMPKK